MKRVISTIIFLITLQLSFSQSNAGSYIYNPYKLNLAKDSITTINLEQDRNLFLTYSSFLPQDVYFQVLIEAQEKPNLQLSVLRRVLSGKADSIKLDEFSLSAPISNIKLSALDDERYIMISNRNPNFKGSLKITLKSIENIILPVPKIDFTEGSQHKFSLDKYSGSTFFSIDADGETPALANFHLPATNTKSKVNSVSNLNLNITIYDTSLNPVYIIGTHRDKHKSTFQAVLDKGSYYLKIHNLQNSWPTDTLPDALSKSVFTFEIAEINPLPEPPNSIKLFSGWLKESGLNKYFDLALYFTGNGSENTSLVPSIDTLFKEIKHSIALERIWRNATKSEKNQIKSLFGKNFKGGFVFGLGDLDSSIYKRLMDEGLYNKEHEPSYFIYLKPFIDRFDVEVIEAKYYQEFNKSLWSKFFDKIRLYSNVPFEKIVIYAPVPCAGGLIYLSDKDNKNTLSRNGMECTSGGHSTLLVDYSSINTGSSVEISRKIDLSKNLDDFLKTNMFNNSGYSIEYLEKDRYSFNILIRNIKGQILKGNNNWEKIEIKCFIREGENGKYLHAETDGVYTSGLGVYPRDTQFDKSFEPIHKQKLVEFSQKFVSGYKNYIYK